MSGISAERSAALAAELEEVRGKNPSGILMPEEVVEYARHSNGLLHSEFTWDDTKAAHEYRLWQARQIIRVVVRIVEPPGGAPQPQRIYVSVSSVDGYKPLKIVLQSKRLRRQHILDVLTRIGSYLELNLYPELAPIARAVERVKASITPPKKVRRVRK